MEKIIGWIKAHPMLTAVVAVGVLLLIFWPSSNAGGGGASSGETSAALQASAIATSQQANAQLQLSSDQVRAIGIQAAAMESMNASDNAAAVEVARMEAATNQQTIAAELAGLQSSNMTELSLGKMAAQTEALLGIAQILPTTQATALAHGQASDAAGFSLTEMFRNLLNQDKGIAATASAIATSEHGTIFTTIGADGKAVESHYLSLPGPSKTPTAAKASTNITNNKNSSGSYYGGANRPSDQSRH